VINLHILVVNDHLYVTVMLISFLICAREEWDPTAEFWFSVERKKKYGRIGFTKQTP